MSPSRARGAAVSLLLSVAPLSADAETGPPDCPTVGRVTLGDLDAGARETIRNATGPVTIQAAEDVIGGASPGVAPAPGSSSPGDRVTVSKDGDFVLAPAFGDEGRLAPRDGPAGGADFAAFRFATGDLARLLPVDLTGVIVGFDNARGRTSWPLIAIAREDRSSPLAPDLSALAASTGFSAPLTLPAPAGSGPDVFQRMAVALPSVTIAEDLTLDDGSLSDSFDRADGTLQDLFWIECVAAECPGARRLFLVNGRVAKTTPGVAIALRSAKAPAVHAMRPVFDRDLRIRVDYDVSAPGAQAVGLAFRVEVATPFPPPGALDRVYVAEYRKSPPTISLRTVSGGMIGSLGSGMLVPARDTGTLEVRVEGVSPTRIRVVRNGVQELEYTDSDPALNFGGWMAGIASLDTQSTGETWDSFTVLRNPDVFAVVQYPASEDAALPAERSPSALPRDNVLFSTDGSTWSRETLAPGCARPANGFVQLRTEDTTSDALDNVFRAEYAIDAMALACTTCLTRDNPCRSNPSPNDAIEPVFEVGKPVDVSPSWWNEHAPDLDSILVRTLVYSGDCFLGTPVSSDSIVMDPGQSTTLGARHATTPAPALVWTPATAGTYCIVALEFYDLNRDGCPDGFESGPPCRMAGNPDQNFHTQGLYRLVEVYPACTPVASSNLHGNGLRAAKSRLVPGEEELSWSLVDATQLPGTYNVHATEVSFELEEPFVRRFVPVLREVVGALGVRLGVPAPLLGAGFVAVFQNDGCASARSLPDP